MSNYSVKIIDPPPMYSSERPTEVDTSTAFESSSDLIIGIDFGTTFTGVAYAHSGSGTKTATATTSDMRKVGEKVVVIKSWPSQSGYYAEKTPTVLAYNQANPTWGASVKPRDEPQIAHFKLGLQENVGRHYLTRSTTAANTALGGFLNNHNWKHPDLPQKKAVDYSADYLTCICDYVTKEILPSHFGANFLKNQQVSYVITVPAIWSDKAKELTRQAAIRAGITRRKLMLITEPEAAALACATLCDEVDLREGDRFLVCDAGGGTVDLIAYKVATLTPFSVEECSVGTGAACGSIYLDQAFISLLTKKFGRKADTVLTKKRVAELVRHFDISIKRQYNPLDERCETEYEIAFAGVQDMPEIGLEDGYLRLSKADIQSIFDPIYNQILKLVQDQMDAVQGTYREKLKTLFLVGGLGSNVYLSKFLQTKLKSTIDVKQPHAGYTAIMRGAVLYKLGLDFVKDRMMRMSYGVRMRSWWRQGYHPESRRVVGLDGEPRCRGVMDWYAHKGQKLANDCVMEHDFVLDWKSSLYLAPGPLEHTTTLWVSEEEVPPEYDGSSATKSHGQLTVNLRSLPTGAFEKKSGPKGDYYSVRYQIGLIFGPGGIEFRCLYKGQVYGSVECDYE